MTTERDAELSALLDGALAAPEAAALRSELERDPALAARLAELAQVDAALRALPARPVPADLRARLHAKLAAEATVRPHLGAIRASAAGLPRRRRAWLAGASAAIAAAAAALVVLLAGGPTGRRIEGSAVTTELAVEPAPPSLPSPDPGAIAPEFAPSAATDQPPALALDPSPAASPTGSPDPSRIASTLAPAVEPPVAEESSPIEAASGAVAPSALAVAPTPATSPSPSMLEASAPPAPAASSQVAATEAPAPEILVELTDEEADALGALEPNDAGIVAVLDFLDELDSLEAEAS